MSEPWAGFWQVVFDDPEEEIIPYPPLYTTLSLRSSGFSLYAGGYFIEIRTEKGRRPPQGWPATTEEKIHYFRTSSACGGSCSWTKAGDSWTAEHQISTSADPRSNGSRIRYVATFDGDRARVQVTCRDGTSRSENWRRLSGVGSSPLAGVWKSTGPKDRWLFAVTAGHYAVTREDLQRPSVSAGALSDQAVSALCDGFGANAGAIVVSAGSFDNWPMVASSVAGFEARKHETFRLKTVEPHRLVLALAADGSDASEWTRLG
jgi:hypothetical protein